MHPRFQHRMAINYIEKARKDGMEKARKWAEEAIPKEHRRAVYDEVREELKREAEV